MSPAPRAEDPAAPPRTVPDLVLPATREAPDWPVMLVRREGRFAPLSWGALGRDLQAFAGALTRLGLLAGDRVAILSENQPRWAVADLGTLLVRGVTVPIYPTLPGNQVAALLADAGAKVLVVSRLALWERLRGACAACQALELVVLMEEGALSGPHGATPAGGPRMLGWDQFLDSGRVEPGVATRLEAARAAARGDDLATIIYTSGTTGEPKGVMLTHENLLWTLRAASQVLALSSEDVYLSFLPLSHIFERLAGYYLMLARRAVIAYAESLETVPRDLREVRPTVVCAVPRFYEKVHARIRDAVAAKPAPLRWVLRQALAAGEAATRAALTGGRTGWGLRVGHLIADRLVYAKLRTACGGRVRVFVSGGAPLPEALAWFFQSAGLLILEGYGLTETSGVVSVNAPAGFRFGTVGRPLPGVEVRIAEDGEILTRGPHVMRGYYRRDAWTHEVLKDGWFQTGDIGRLDPDGFLRITDRKKELIVTSGGKKVAPQQVEALLKQDPLVNQILVHGDRRHYLTALIVPHPEVLLAVGRAVGLHGPDWRALLTHPAVLQAVRARLATRQAGLARFEQVKDCRLVDREWTIEAGELTPTLKVRRAVLAERHRTLLDSMYGAGAPADQPG